VSKKDRAAARVSEPPRMHAVPTGPELEGLQGVALMAAGAAGFLYLVRMSGAFGYPMEHIVGIGCWGVMLVCAALRFAWERRQGNFPARWGGLLVLCFASLFTLGLLVELGVATAPDHTQNQPANLF